MSHLQIWAFKEDFIEGFTKAGRLGLCIGGYAILVALLLSILAPSLPVFEAMVDGTALQLMGYASILVLTASFVNGIMHCANNRAKATYSRSGNIQPAK
jgi:hypothetical protein